MGSSAAAKVACVVVVICMVLVAAPLAVEASITCGQVASSLAPCLAYLRNGGAVSPGCCSGIKNLNNAAKTTPDRQTACTCLKDFSKSYSGLNLAAAAGLPSRCGVDVPYKISPATDCSKVK